MTASWKPGADVGSHIRAIDHVAIATANMAEPVALFAGVLGATLLAGGDNDTTGTRLMHLALGGFKIELMQPLRDDSLIAARVAEHGPGFHHLTFVVDDVDATARDLQQAGGRTVGTDLSSPRWRETFLAPKLTFGTLLQFVDTTRRWDVPATSYDIDDVLAGRVVWRDYIDCLRDSVGTPEADVSEASLRA